MNSDPTSGDSLPIIREPLAIVDVGHGCRVGITTDDGCFLVLYPQAGGAWKPGKHIPPEAVKKMAELLAGGLLK